MLARAAILSKPSQLVSIPIGAVGGSVFNSTASDGTQLAAFAFIRTHSALTDRVITNTQCLTGTIADGDFQPRLFAVAAFTERGVLVEG